jgi:hypothetical protein
MDFRRDRLQFQIGKVLDWTNATFAYRMVCSGIMRGIQNFRKHHRLSSSPCGTLPIVPAVGTCGGASTRRRAGSTRSRESARFPCCDSEISEIRRGMSISCCQIGNKYGTFACCPFGLPGWKPKADALGSKMGSKFRFGKAVAVWFYAQRFESLGAFVRARRKLLLSASYQANGES